MAAEWWEVAGLAARAGEPVLLVGPPGTGKTYWAGTLNVGDVRRCIMTADTPSAELRGHYVPSPDGFIWKDGPAVAWLRHGGTLVVDEVEKGAEDVQAFLLGVLDSAETVRAAGAITLPTGETVRPSGAARAAVLTANSTDSIIAPLLDRCWAVEVDRPHPAAWRAVERQCGRAVAEAAAVRWSAADPSASVRTWLRFVAVLRTSRDHGDCVAAARSLFGRGTCAALREALAELEAASPARGAEAGYVRLVADVFRDAAEGD